MVQIDAAHADAMVTEVGNGAEVLALAAVGGGAHGCFIIGAVKGCGCFLYGTFVTYGSDSSLETDCGIIGATWIKED